MHVASALQALSGGQAAPKTVGIMCRNHRGFVESLVAATRSGADVVLMNTSFAGPALAEVVKRESVDIVIYDEEFTAAVDQALAGNPDAARIFAWTDDAVNPIDLTVEKLIAANVGQRPKRLGKGKLIMLTAGTTGTPKGAKRSGGGPEALAGDSERRYRGGPRRPPSWWRRCFTRGDFSVGFLGDDGLHRGHPSQVRPRGHP